VTIPDLSQNDFTGAFTFARSEAATYVDAAGAEQLAPAGTPRFDHDDAGMPLGLLVGPGSDIGGGDRITVLAGALPDALVNGTVAADRAATVFHVFLPAGAPSTAIERRAWYTRNVRAMIDALLAQAGHHLAIGAIAGLRVRAGDDGGGFVRFRGQVWQLAPALAGDAAGTPLAFDAAGTVPLITGNA